MLWVANRRLSASVMSIMFNANISQQSRLLASSAETGFGARVSANLALLVFLVVFAVEHVFYRAAYFLADFGGSLPDIFASFFYIGGRVAGCSAYLASLVGSAFFHLFCFVAHSISTLCSPGFCLIKRLKGSIFHFLFLNFS